MHAALLCNTRVVRGSVATSVAPLGTICCRSVSRLVDGVSGGVRFGATYYVGPNVELSRLRSRPIEKIGCGDQAKII